MLPKVRTLMLTSLVVTLVFWIICGSAIAEAEEETPPPYESQENTPAEDKMPQLKTALVCEVVKNGTCERPTVVLSVEKKQAFCYTLFENVSAPRIIYHRWYHRGELTTQVKLKLQPPRWATYSSIQLREADKGPWQIEIVDESGRIYETLRFSITD